MTDKAVSALTSLTGANTATGDLLYIVDISEAAAADRSKKITAQELQNYVKKFPATIGVGGATPAASGAGISFPATASASSDANTLDDYEEGTWTPTAVCTGQTIAYSSRSGNYTKIGNVVRAECTMILSTVTGSAAGNTTIQGLPFSNGLSFEYGGLGFVSYNTGFVNTVSASWISGTDALFRTGTRSDANDAGGFSASGYINIVWVYQV